MEPIKQVNKVAAFISPLFTLSAQAHIFHLQVKGAGSFAAHLALNDLYTSLPALVDKLVETYQGRYGIITGYNCPTLVDARSKEHVIACIADVVHFIDSEKDTFVDSELLNIVDEIKSLIIGTLYKLENLS